jgi:hypothetical protein
MTASLARWFGVLGGTFLLSVATLGSTAAVAKTIPMRPMSRSAVESVCSRAGGATFGLHDDSGPYGCVSGHGQVECSSDGACLGYVSDLVRMPANSIEAVLGVGGRGEPIKIGPAERRITPIAAQP